MNPLDIFNRTPLDLLNSTENVSGRKVTPTKPAIEKEMTAIDKEVDLTQTVAISVEVTDFVPERKSSTTDVSQQDHTRLRSLLTSVGAVEGRLLQEHQHDVIPTKLPPFPTPYTFCQGYFKCAPGEDPWVDSIPKVYRELDTHIRKRLADHSETLAYSSDEAFACALQMRELTLLRQSGSRVLCLDGGGMKGLIQIEVLEQIEKLTQRKITEIFDWIVGTSVGGIVALAIVYGRSEHVP